MKRSYWYFFALILVMLTAAAFIACGSSGGSSSSGSDDDGGSDDDSATAAFCSDMCQKGSDCGMTAPYPHDQFGTSLSYCLSNCPSWVDASIEACANNCDYSAGCDPWHICVICTCGNQCGDDDTTG